MGSKKVRRPTTRLLDAEKGSPYRYNSFLLIWLVCALRHNQCTSMKANSVLFLLFVPGSQRKLCSRQWASDLALSKAVGGHRRWEVSRHLGIPKCSAGFTKTSSRNIHSGFYSKITLHQISGLHVSHFPITCFPFPITRLVKTLCVY